MTIYKGCILSKFYIKPQPVSTRNVYRNVVSYRNSTSNHNVSGNHFNAAVLYLIEILHQTTTRSAHSPRCLRCILSKFYIKPQRSARFYFPELVVSYRNSTSNHNDHGRTQRGGRVVSYRNSTSNHNLADYMNFPVGLYLIEILHQTTTLIGIRLPGAKLYLIEILHQTTTSRQSYHEAHELYLIEILHQTTTLLLPSRMQLMLYLIEILHQTTTSCSFPTSQICCILSKFYIKPQPDLYAIFPQRCCILSKFYIKPQPFCPGQDLRRCCILSKFYIKPQRLSLPDFAKTVVSYRNSTSNHNFSTDEPIATELYLIEILHQTTTV